MRIGDVLAKWRWAKRMNIRDTAQVMGISAPTLSRIENGERMDGVVLAKVLVWLLGEWDAVSRTGKIAVSSATKTNGRRKVA